MDISSALLATGHLTLWVLLFGLFFPRLTLLCACFVPGAYPPNTVPDLLNLLGGLFFPRFLTSYYIYTDMGLNTIWFWAYLVTGIIGIFGESSFVHHRVRRRTTISRDGRTTTTVVEEEI